MSTERAVWYFTFGFGHSTPNGTFLGNRYLVIDGATYDEARDRITALRGQKWCMQYDEDGFAGQPARFGLIQITEDQLRADAPTTVRSITANELDAHL